MSRALAMVISALFAGSIAGCVTSQVTPTYEELQAADFGRVMPRSECEQRAEVAMRDVLDRLDHVAPYRFRWKKHGKGWMYVGAFNERQYGYLLWGSVETTEEHPHLMPWVMPCVVLMRDGKVLGGGHVPWDRPTRQHFWIEDFGFADTVGAEDAR